MTTTQQTRAEAERLQKQIAAELKNYIYRVVVVPMPAPKMGGAK